MNIRSSQQPLLTKLESFICLGRGSTSSTQSQMATGWVAETKEQHLLYVNSVKIIKDFWRPETCGSTASSRTCNKLAEFTATDNHRNGNLRWVQKGKRQIHETQLWAPIKHNGLGATTAQTSPEAAAGRQAKGEDGSRPALLPRPRSGCRCRSCEPPFPTPAAPPCLPLLLAAPTPPPHSRYKSQLSASAPALPKPAGQAGGCRSLPSRCFIRGRAKHRRLKPGHCRRCRLTQAGSEGNARLFSPARSQSMTIFTPVYVPALITPKGRLDTQRLQPSLYLQANALSHLSLPHPGNRWEMRSPKLCGEESAPAARGQRACRGPCPSCLHVRTLVHHCLVCTRGKKNDPPLCLYHGTCAATGTHRPQCIFPLC